MKEILIECVRHAGGILMQHFGQVRGVRVKENPASIVTDADYASEAAILELLRRSFPDHNILSEEAGYTDRQSPFTWIIDPLDGTSNFAAGLPWFGVMVALLEKVRPVLAAMYLPVEDALYVAEDRGGAWCNGGVVHVTSATSLSEVLCAHSLDPRAEFEVTQREVQLLARLVQRARNVRCTNCLLDFAATIDGRFGACINHSAKVWDIAAPALLLREAGGLLADVRGREITFDLRPEHRMRSYRVMAANPTLLAELATLARESGLDA